MALARPLVGIVVEVKVQLGHSAVAEEPFNSLGRLFGASSESVETLVAINALLSDPAMQRTLAAVREEDANVRAEADAMSIR